MAARLLTTLSLIVAGVLLGTLGTFSTPVGHGVSQYWPGIVVQSAGGVWFGAWGGLAGSLFPIITNWLTGGTTANLIGFIPANLAQGMIPAWAFRRFAMSPDIPGWRGLFFYALWGAAVPSLAGGLLGVLALAAFGQVSGSAQFWRLAFTWIQANTLVALLLGPPVLRVLTPLLAEYGLLVRGYWK